MTFTGMALGVVSIASAFTGQATSATASTVPVALTIDRSVLTYARYVDYTNREEVSEYVKEYFADVPVLSKIAFCESAYRHFGINGAILRGNVDSDDIGVMQINMRYHSDDAQKLGLDLFSLEGNLEYARHLYEKQGVKPWKSSSRCWMNDSEKENTSA